MSGRIHTLQERESGRLEGEQLIGSTIGTNKLEELLDFSSKSWIFKAKDNLDRTVAVKVLKPGLGLAREEQLLKEEGPALAKLEECPHIVTIYTAGHDSNTGLAYITTQFVDGKNLRVLAEFPQRGEKPARFSNYDIPRIAYEVAIGIEAIHKLGLEHRDVKPSNVLIEKATNKAYLIDLGGTKNPSQGIDDIKGTGKVLEYLINHSEKKVPSEIIQIAQKAKDRRYDSIIDLRKDLGKPVWWSAKIQPLKSIPGVTRRTLLRAAATATTAILTGGSIKLARDYFGAMERIVEEIRETDPTDWNRIDKLFTELEKRTFLQKVMKWDEEVPAGEFVAGTDQQKWFTSPSINSYNGDLSGCFWVGWNKTKMPEFKEAALRRTNEIVLTKEDNNYINAVRFFNSRGRAFDMLGAKGIEHQQKALEALKILSSKYHFQARAFQIVPTKQFQSEAGIMYDVIPFHLWGYKVTGENEFLVKALTHTKTTIETNIREDGSVRKTAIYEIKHDRPVVIGEKNSKGLRDDSTLARAQAQMLHGLTAAYLFSRNDEILSAARRVANYYLERTRETKFIPFFDLDAPALPNTQIDTAPPAMIARSLKIIGAATGDINYENNSRKIKKELISNYHSTNVNYSGVLTGVCDNHPKKEYVGGSTIYGDLAYLDY